MEAISGWEALITHPRIHVGREDQLIHLLLLGGTQALAGVSVRRDRRSGNRRTRRLRFASGPPAARRGARPAPRCRAWHRRQSRPSRRCSRCPTLPESPARQSGRSFPHPRAARRRLPQRCLWCVPSRSGRTILPIRRAPPPSRAHGSTGRSHGLGPPRVETAMVPWRALLRERCACPEPRSTRR